jgi:hypothetical protein
VFHQEQSAHQHLLRRFDGWANEAKQPSVEPKFFDLGLSPRAFCDDRAQGASAELQKCCGPRNAYTAATKLLNIASALTRPFRIVWTVTILQQAFSAFTLKPVGARRSANASSIEATGNHEWPSPAEGLSKGWRFFPTYARA